MLRFLQAIFTQMAQNVARNRHHSIEQQLCRWLLLIRYDAKLMALMLGVRRERTRDYGAAPFSSLIEGLKILIRKHPGIRNLYGDHSLVVTLMAGIAGFRKLFVGCPKRRSVMGL